jgi:phage tail-like protein
MPRRATDPLASYNFLVESGGILGAGFSECTGLGAETDAIDYREGKDDIHVRKLPGLKKFGNVTLKRGVSINQEFFNWRKSVLDGDIDRRDISIILLDEKRNEQVRYNLASAWPVKWTGPEFKASANEVAVETLEIVHEGVSIG